MFRGLNKNVDINVFYREGKTLRGMKLIKKNKQKSFILRTNFPYFLPTVVYIRESQPFLTPNEFKLKEDRKIILN